MGMLNASLSITFDLITSDSCTHFEFDVAEVSAQKYYFYSYLIFTAGSEQVNANRAK
jgi:hypothetical protein